MQAGVSHTNIRVHSRVGHGQACVLPAPPSLVISKPVRSKASICRLEASASGAPHLSCKHSLEFAVHWRGVHRQVLRHEVEITFFKAGVPTTRGVGTCLPARSSTRLRSMTYSSTYSACGGDLRICMVFRLCAARGAEWLLRSMDNRCNAQGQGLDRRLVTRHALASGICGEAVALQRRLTLPSVRLAK